MPVMLEASAAWTAITEALTNIVSSVTSVFTFISSAAVLPYFVIGIGASLMLLGVKVVRRIVWGA